MSLGNARNGGKAGKLYRFGVMLGNILNGGGYVASGGSLRSGNKTLTLGQAQKQGVQIRARIPTPVNLSSPRTDYTDVTAYTKACDADVALVLYTMGNVIETDKINRLR